MAALFITSNVADHEQPASITCIGPPSISAGRCTPCQWVVVSSASVLLTVIPTVSPLVMISVGPQKAEPL